MTNVAQIIISVFDHRVKTFSGKEKMLVTSIFPISHNAMFSEGLILCQGCSSHGCVVNIRTQVLQSPEANLFQEVE